MKRVIVLGATGSVGGNSLAVIRDHPDEFRVVGLVGGRASTELAALCREFPEAAVALGRPDAARAFSGLLDPARPGKFFDAADGALQLLAETPTDLCVAAVSGTAGLSLAFAAAAHKMTILLANKEVLVSAGRLFMAAARENGSAVMPLDSEHTALWQCLHGRDRKQVEKLIITASGGPFRQWSRERMAAATPADALKHPVWRMGAKISIDSATLANKALELIEAHHLFGLPYDAMEALVHPQSAIHGMVQFRDGSLIAHMGVCDMRQPIAYMLFYPQGHASSLPRVDLAALGRLEFEPADTGRFPLLALGSEAGRRQGGYPALFNAANEAAVELFLNGRIAFPDIARAVEKAMTQGRGAEPANLDEVAAIHEQARRTVMESFDKTRPSRVG